jgi:hypothetical protein
MDRAVGGCRKLHRDDYSHNLQSDIVRSPRWVGRVARVNDINKYKNLSRNYEWKRPSVTRKMILAEHVERQSVKGNEYRILVGKSDGKKPLG